MRKIAVTGGRGYSDEQHVMYVLDEVGTGEILLIHGGASGADASADRWAKQHGVFVAKFPVYPITWNRIGLAAGPLRNRLMLTIMRPDLLVAFPGGSGTDGCVEEAKSLGVEVRDER